MKTFRKVHTHDTPIPIPSGPRGSLGMRDPTRTLVRELEGDAIDYVIEQVEPGIVGVYRWTYEPATVTDARAAAADVRHNLKRIEGINSANRDFWKKG